MMKKEQDARRRVMTNVVVVFLLLGLAGCVKTFESEPRPVAPGPEPLASSSAILEPATELPAGKSQEATAGAAFEAPIKDDLSVEEILLAERDGERALVVHLSRPPDDVRQFTLDSPDRAVADLSGPLVPGVRARRYTTSDPVIAAVRVALYEGRLRIVADLEQPAADYRVERDGRSVTMLLGLAAEPVKTQVLYLAPGSEHVFSQAEPALEPVPPSAATGDPTAAAASPITSPLEAAASAPVEVPEVVTREEEPSRPVALGGARAYALPVVADAASADAGAAAEDTAAEGTAIAQSGAGWPGGAESSPGHYVGERISLDFKDADIQNVLRILADVSGLNIITTEDVKGRLTMRLVDVPWDQALEAILKAKGLDMVRDANIVRVSTVEQLKKEREARRAADEAQRQVEPLRVRYVKVNYAKADESLVKKVREVLTERGTATWDERTNTVVIRDIARGIADAEELITQFDTQTPQVMIEANIVEATAALIRDLGIQWGHTYRASPETGNAPGVNFPGRVGAGGVLAGGENSPAGSLPFIADFPAAVAPGAGAAYDILLGSLDGSNTLNARLTALEREGKGKIISRPRVVTLNNVPAKIASLEILRVRLPSTGTVIATGAGGAAGSATSATEKIETGIVLQVTPQVSGDGFIFLDVYAKSSTASRERSTDDIPNEVSREANSHVLIKNGETFVLGGVFRNELNQVDRGIPYLRSIPVLGWLFKSKLNDDSRQELLVFITPRTTRARGTESFANLPSAEALWHNRALP